MAIKLKKGVFSEIIEYLGHLNTRRRLLVGRKVTKAIQMLPYLLTVSKMCFSYGSCNEYNQFVLKFARDAL